MKLFLILALALCAQAADVKEKEDTAEPTQNKEKRQTQDEIVPGHLVYRTARKQEQSQVAPVEERQDDDKLSRDEEYRPGQVFSLNAQELLELQPERKAPLGSDQLLQQLYVPAQQEHKQNLQQVYYLEPQVSRQVSLHPSSHAVIARPHFSSNGGEASVGAALSVSDTGANPEPFDQELLALLQVRPEEPRQAYSQPQPIQQTSAPNLSPSQYQQIERFITKPIKKQTKLRNKVINPTTASTAPQQYLIETTNVQQQQQQQQQQLQLQQQQQFSQQLQQQQQQQTLQQYRPVAQPQRPIQSLRYVPIQQTQPALQQVVYERPETQGLKVVPAPKLQQLQQQPRPQLAYRIIPQYQPIQQEATPKQYRLVEAPRPQPVRQEQRLSSAERPISYLKRYPEPEKMRTLKIYEPVELPSPPQPAQIIGEQYYLRPVPYRQNEQRARYDLPVPLRQVEQSRPVEATKAPSSAIYVSKNLAPKKIKPQLLRPEPTIKVEQQRLEQQSLDVNIEHQSIEEQRAHLPPPKNNRAYTPEEFAALVAAGYSVTPVPVSALNSHVAQSRSSIEAAPAQLKRRPLYRRPQYLPVRDDAP